MTSRAQRRQRAAHFEGLLCGDRLACGYGVHDSRLLEAPDSGVGVAVELCGRCGATYSVSAARAQALREAAADTRNFAEWVADLAAAAR